MKQSFVLFICCLVRGQTESVRGSIPCRGHKCSGADFYRFGLFFCSGTSAWDHDTDHDAVLKKEQPPPQLAVVKSAVDGPTAVMELVSEYVAAHYRRVLRSVCAEHQV